MGTSCDIAIQGLPVALKGKYEPTPFGEEVAIQTEVVDCERKQQLPPSYREQPGLLTADSPIAACLDWPGRRMLGKSRI